VGWRYKRQLYAVCIIRAAFEWFVKVRDAYEVRRRRRHRLEQWRRLLGTRRAPLGGMGREGAAWKLPELTESERRQRARLSPHAFRHTFETQSIATDVPLGVVQQLLRHASLKTTSERGGWGLLLSVSFGV
jgi:integrase